jgi:hypothetical protein
VSPGFKPVRLGSVGRLVVSYGVTGWDVTVWKFYITVIETKIIPVFCIITVF